MESRLIQAIANLLPATCSRREKYGVRLLSQRSEERLLTDFHGKIVMLARITERSRHAAASGIKHLQSVADQPFENQRGSLNAPERLLVTMTMKDDRHLRIAAGR